VETPVPDAVAIEQIKEITPYN